MINQSIISGGIFSKKPSVNERPTKLRFETEDFNASESLMENLLSMEDMYYQITREHMVATHLFMKDGNVEILQEGFKDFFNSVVEFFARMLESFKNYMKKAYMYLNAYIGSFDAFLYKNKDALNSLTPDFTIKGFRYTFENNIPDLRGVGNIIREYNIEMGNLSKKTKGEIMKEKEAFHADDQMGKLRAEVMGIQPYVSAGEYTDELKKLFRSGDKEQIEIRVNQSELRRAISDYSKLKETLNHCATERDYIITMVEDLRDFFKKGPSIHYKGREDKVAYTPTLLPGVLTGHVQKGEHIPEMNEHEATTEMMDKLNAFYHFKWSQSKEIGFMCTQAMTEKLHAIKEAIAQCKTIVRKSLFSKTKKTEEA